MMLIKTYVAPSPIHGMGLFAAEAIGPATPIWRFEPGFDHDFSREAFAQLPRPAREHTRWFCFVSKQNGHVILSGDHACFINHTLNPNTGAAADTSSPVTTVALRPIAPGEELTCNYFDYDADTPWKLGLVPPDAPLGATKDFSIAK
jgi:SET domain-containing protein